MPAPQTAAAPSAPAPKPSLAVQRRVNAPPAKVYAAWTDPQQLVRWFGPPGAQSKKAEIDARVGGRYRISFVAPDGESYGVGGVYREVVPNAKLVFTWAWQSTPERESLVTVTFRAEGAATLVSVTHEQFFDDQARDRHRQGWDAALDKIAQMFA